MPQTNLDFFMPGLCMIGFTYDTKILFPNKFPHQHPIIDPHLWFAWAKVKWTWNWASSPFY